MNTTRPSQPRAAWASADDMAVFNLVVILIGVCVGSYLLWTNYHTEISATVLTIQQWQIDLAKRFAGALDVPDTQAALAHPADLTLSDLYAITREVGTVLRVPAAMFILLLAIVCVFRAAPARFRRKFDLDRLTREQAVTFPTSTAFARRRLRLVEPNKASPRPCDYALSAAEWIDAVARKDGRFDEEAARRALVEQLGPRWTQPEEANDAARFIFAVFALHLAVERDAALALLGAASAALDGPGDGDEGPPAPLALPAHVLTAADNVLGNPTISKPAREIAARHAHTNPALMMLLTGARASAGVLAPAQFAWLKLVDRGLWYALHSLGFETEDGGRYLHPTPRIEAIGARDHWAVERAVASPMAEPAVDRALEAIRRIAVRSESFVG
ncbi:MAG TPA: hypothetical protein VJY39_02960 [Acidisphaera sp.]|nr:hypothetical protein [Acidisphaera sp.]